LVALIFALGWFAADGGAMITKPGLFLRLLFVFRLGTVFVLMRQSLDRSGLQRSV